MVSIRHVGGLSARQLGKILDEARASSRTSADSQLAEADKLAGEGKQVEAAKLYAAAIDAAPKKWSKFPRAAEALMLALALTRNNAECASRAQALYPRLAGTAAGANIASTGLGCATSLENQEALVSSLEKLTREQLANSKLGISDDDRSSMYIALIGAREAAKDNDGAAAMVREWVSFLEQAAARAATPEQRTVYDSHRLSAYLEAATPEKAIPMLEQSARDFPDDYNPHSRMAIAYRAMKEYEKALAASDRALALAYGPRKIGFLRTRADIYADMGNKEAARKTIEETIVYAKSMPKEQVRAATIAALEKKLDALK